MRLSPYRPARPDRLTAGLFVPGPLALSLLALAAPASAQDLLVGQTAGGDQTQYGSVTLAAPLSTEAGAVTVEGFAGGLRVIPFDPSVSGYPQVEVYNTSALTVAAGDTTYYVTAYGSSQVGVVSGGRINSLTLNDASTASVSGDTSRVGYLQLSGTAAATVTGGSLSFISLHATSTAAISGGDIGALIVYDQSVAAVTGGTIGRMEMDGGKVVGPKSPGPFSMLPPPAASFPTLDLLGTGLTLAGGEITGTLQDGTPLAAPFADMTGGQAVLEFNGQRVPLPVPEASTTAGLGLLLALGAILKMGRVAAARRRRKEVP